MIATVIPVPTADALAHAANQLRTAQNSKAIDRALAALGAGRRVSVVGGKFMVEGSTGNIYTVTFDGASCTCEARGACWHMQVPCLLEQANRPAMSYMPTPAAIEHAHELAGLTMPNLLDRRSKALVEISELF